MLMSFSPFSSRMVCILGMSAALSVPMLMPAGAAEDDSPMVVRTEKDLEQGAQNVKSVMLALSQMFAEDTPVPSFPGGKGLMIEQPYMKIIKGANERSTLIFRPRFTTVKQMFRAIDGVIVGTALIEKIDEQNELIINAPTAEIDNYREILLAMDVPNAQVLIEAKIVEVTFKDETFRNLSLDYTTGGNTIGATTQVPGVSSQPSSGLGGSFNPLTGSDSMNISFKWLQEAQDARILSSPNILISRNETSRIITGQDVPIQEANTTGNTLQLSTKYKNVGVQLEVEPSMVNNDNVTLRVYPKVSNITGYQTVGEASQQQYSVPVIAVRSVESYLRLHDKQVVMMGGLYSSRKSLQQQRIPVLSDLPFLGELFTGKNQVTEVTQLIFFLKVHIIRAEDVSGGTLYNPLKQGEQSEALGEMVQNLKTTPILQPAVKNLFVELFNATPNNEVKQRESYWENLVRQQQTSKPGEEVR